MSRRWYWLAFGGLLALALLAQVPLRLAGLDRAGVSASAATGTIWDGRLIAAQFRGVPLGDIETGLAPLPLLAGQMRFNLAASGIDGTIVRSAGGFGVMGLNGRTGPLVIGSVPITAIDFRALTFDLKDGACAAASGQIIVQPAAALAGAEVLTGTPQCDGDGVLLPLASASGLTRLDVRIDAARQVRATLAIDGAAEVVRPALLAAGFAPTPRGLALVMEGRL